MDALLLLYLLLLLLYCPSKHAVVCKRLLAVEEVGGWVGEAKKKARGAPLISWGV